jgi:signal transduction histidine kinase
VSRRWRPSLAFVLGGGLVGTLVMSVAGLVALRYLGPALGFRAAAALLAAAITLTTAVVGGLMVRLLLRPIRALEAYALAQERGQAASPPDHFGTRELFATATRVIAMAETQRDREATIRAYTDHVTHELKTPASTIRAAVELMQSSESLSPEDQALLAQIDGARAQLEAQLAALRRAAQARETRYLGQSTLAEVLPALARDGPAPTLTLTSAGETLPLPIAAEGLTIVLGQLLRNAAENGARSVALQAEAARGRVGLRIADDGHGISAGNSERIFAPFFTTHREDGGTGMGLAVVRNILQAHHAEIRLMPAARGATFLITFNRPP